VILDGNLMGRIYIAPMNAPRFRPLAGILALVLSLGLGLGPARMLLAGSAGTGALEGVQHQHHGASDRHHATHPPGGDCCCDLCCSCCAAFAAPHAMPVGLRVAVGQVRLPAPPGAGRLASAPLHHLLPFAQAPPPLLI
jgi:hypothetical protein